MPRRLVALAVSLTVATAGCAPLAATAVVAGAGTTAIGFHIGPKADDHNCAGSMRCAFDILLGATLALIGIGLVAGGGIALGADALR